MIVSSGPGVALGRPTPTAGLPSPPMAVHQPKSRPGTVEQRRGHRQHRAQHRDRQEEVPEPQPGHQPPDVAPGRDGLPGGVDQPEPDEGQDGDGQQVEGIHAPSRLKGRSQRTGDRPLVS